MKMYKKTYPVCSFLGTPSILLLCIVLIQVLPLPSSGLSNSSKKSTDPDRYLPRWMDLQPGPGRAYAASPLADAGADRT